MKCIDSDNYILIMEYTLYKSFIDRSSIKIDCKTYHVYQGLVTTHCIINFEEESSKYFSKLIPPYSLDSFTHVRTQLYKVKYIIMNTLILTVKQKYSHTLL